MKQNRFSAQLQVNQKIKLFRTPCFLSIPIIRGSIIISSVMLNYIQNY